MHSADVHSLWHGTVQGRETTVAKIRNGCVVRQWERGRLICIFVSGKRIYLHSTCSNKLSAVSLAWTRDVNIWALFMSVRRRRRWLLRPSLLLLLSRQRTDPAEGGPTEQRATRSSRGRADRSESEPIQGDSSVTPLPTANGWFQTHTHTHHRHCRRRHHLSCNHLTHDSSVTLIPTAKCWFQTHLNKGETLTNKYRCQYPCMWMTYEYSIKSADPKLQENFANNGKIMKGIASCSRALFM